MRTLVIALLIAPGPVFAPAIAAAQSSVAGRDPITVTGDNRIICRRVTRTATRMRIGRICRSQSQWAAETGRAPNRNDPNSTIDGAADTLDVMRADCTGTGDGIKSPLDTTPDTPLGPR